MVPCVLFNTFLNLDFNLSHVWLAAAFFVLLVLWVLVFLSIYAFADVDEKAGDLLLPYILWITFAAYLNVGVYLLN